MKKDIFIRLIRAAKFILREADKPQLHSRFDNSLTLLPSEKSEEKGLPKISIEGDLKVSALRFVLCTAALCTIIKLFLKIIY